MTEVLAESVKELQNKGERVLVQLSASWCGPCKTLAPRLQQIGEEYSNVTFLKVDVDKNVDYATGLGVRSVPTVLIYEGEKLIDRSTGVQPEKYYKDILNKL